MGQISTRRAKSFDRSYFEIPFRSIFGEPLVNSTYRRFLIALTGAFMIHFCAQVSHGETILLFTRVFGVNSETGITSTDLPTYGDRVTANVLGPSSFKYG